MVSSQCEGGPHLIKAKPGPSAYMWIWYEHLQPHQVADEAAAVGRDHLDIEHDCLLGRGGAASIRGGQSLERHVGREHDAAEGEMRSMQKTFEKARDMQ